MQILLQAWRARREAGCRSSLLLPLVLILATPVAAHEGLQRYCFECHSGKDSEAGLDLAAQLRSGNFHADHASWRLVRQMLADRRMPPRYAEAIPDDAARQELVAWLDGRLQAAAASRAGDPGRVPPRRLSNFEYDATLSDLCSADLHLAAEFPVDPVGGEGFLNSGESLSLNAPLLEKYLRAARQLAGSHMLLGDDGLLFSSRPLNVEQEKLDFLVGRIDAFYAPYLNLDYQTLLAAVVASSQPDAAPAEHVRRYAEHLRQARQGASFLLGPVFEVLDQDPKAAAAMVDAWHRGWFQLPHMHKSDRNKQARFGAYIFRKTAEQVQRRMQPGPEIFVEQLALQWPPRAGASANPLVIMAHVPTREAAGTRLRLRQPRFEEVDVPSQERSRRAKTGDKGPPPVGLREFLQTQAPALLATLPFDAQGDLILRCPQEIRIELPDAVAQALAGRVFLADAELLSGQPQGLVQIRLVRDGTLPVAPSVLAGEPVLSLPGTPARAQLEQAAAAFLAAFPNGFLDGRLPIALAFRAPRALRDDRALVELLLAPEQGQALEAAFRDLAAAAPLQEQAMEEFLSFTNSRGVFHKDQSFLLGNDKSDLSKPALDHAEAKLRALPQDAPADTYYFSGGSWDITNRDFTEVFLAIRDDLAQQHAAREKREQAHRADLARFAARAFAVPESADLARRVEDIYTQARKEYGLDHRQGIAETLVWVLSSARFLMRNLEAPPGTAPAPLTDWQLARRLASFLWSSVPDAPLRAAAEAGRLRQPSELARQVARMLADPRADRLATAFFGQWLSFADFADFAGINREAYPELTPEVQQAMQEEARGFFAHLIRSRTHGLRAILDADFSYLSPELLEYYGSETNKNRRRGGNDRDRDEFKLVSGMRERGRGGVLGMGAFLVENSPGLRTSPVLRGVWMIETLVGEHIPSPPPNVPDLPEDERKSEMTVRELIRAHTKQPDCAACHARFDPAGLALEGFDPSGRLRQRDAAGRQLDLSAEMADGQRFEGLEGLRAYLLEHRFAEFRRQCIRKLVGFALNRSLIASDEPWVAELAQSPDPLLPDLILQVVQSPHFLWARGAAMPIDQ